MRQFQANFRQRLRALDSGLINPTDLERWEASQRRRADIRPSMLGHLTQIVENDIRLLLQQGREQESASLRAAFDDYSAQFGAATRASNQLGKRIAEVRDRAGPRARTRRKRPGVVSLPRQGASPTGTKSGDSTLWGGRPKSEVASSPGVVRGNGDARSRHSSPLSNGVGGIVGKGGSGSGTRRGGSGSPGEGPPKRARVS